MLTKSTFKTAFINRLLTMFGKDLAESNSYDRYKAMASLVRDLIGQRWLETTRRYDRQQQKQVYYFSAEFLPGRFLDDNLQNLGVREIWLQGLQELKIDYEELVQQEHDMELGSGGLGRLAACFLDSFAATGLPGHGCGIRYTYGLFEQAIINGEQIERPDNWIGDLNIWEYCREDKAVTVQFGEPLGNVTAMPYDIPIIGYRNDTVNTLRLWSAKAPTDININYSTYSPDDFRRLLEHKNVIESISQILYPNDKYEEGQLLRLVQEYFFVSAGIQSIVRHMKKKHGRIRNLADLVAIHINDTHPALAVPELMRILLDEENLAWDEAWRITTATISYTNHTVMPEALEKWPIGKMRTLLPRVFEIIHEINERFCHDLWQAHPGDWQRIAAMAVTSYGQVHMANLAIVGSHSVNGVSKIHSEILCRDVLKNFYEHSPQKFNNKTNGVTHRRWLLYANPELAGLINETIGSTWVHDPNELGRLLPYATDAAFQKQLANAKQKRKQILAKWIQEQYAIAIDPSSLFDVQIKRIHAYKRQLMNLLRIMDMYTFYKNNPTCQIQPRTFIFAGKAAPNYFLAKKIIKLIATLEKLINNDSAVNSKMKIIFIENYGVSLAEKIIPAADISEQISTAGREASGTGNMKLMMNGALTVGTLDGANLEIKDVVGEENIVTFGLTAEEVNNYRASGRCNPLEIYNQNERIRTCINQLVDGSLSAFGDEFKPVFDYLLYGSGEFCELVDFPAYITAQERAETIMNETKVRWRIAATNIAGSGIFSSDNTVREYADKIWHIHTSGADETR